MQKIAVFVLVILGSILLFIVPIEVMQEEGRLLKEASIEYDINHIAYLISVTGKTDTRMIPDDMRYEGYGEDFVLMDEAVYTSPLIDEVSGAIVKDDNGREIYILDFTKCAYVVLKYGHYKRGVVVK